MCQAAVPLKSYSSSCMCRAAVPLKSYSSSCMCRAAVPLKSYSSSCMCRAAVPLKSYSSSCMCRAAVPLKSYSSSCMCRAAVPLKSYSSSCMCRAAVPLKSYSSSCMCRAAVPLKSYSSSCMCRAAVPLKSYSSSCMCRAAVPLKSYSSSCMCRAAVPLKSYSSSCMCRAAVPLKSYSSSCMCRAAVPLKSYSSSCMCRAAVPLKSYSSSCMCRAAVPLKSYSSSCMCRAAVPLKSYSTSWLLVNPRHNSGSQLLNQLVLAALETLPPNQASHYISTILASNTLSQAISSGEKEPQDVIVQGVDLSNLTLVWQQFKSDLTTLNTHQTYSRAVLNLSPGARAVVTNGRVLGPLDAGERFTTDDFSLLERFNMNNYGDKLLAVLKKQGDEDDVVTSDILMQTVALLVSRTQSRSRFEIPFRGEEYSVVKLPPRNPSEPILDLVAVVDPVSRGAQKVGPILSVLQEVLNCNIRLFLNCVEKHSDMPLKSFYRFVLEPELQFVGEGHHSHGPVARFTNMPESILFTQNMHVPENWLVESVRSLYDLDNIRLEDVDSGVHSEFELEYLLLEGHCFEASMGNPPRGLQITLGTELEPVKVDTIVMANLGYFQLKANPGAWTLRLRQGRSAEIFDIVSQEGGHTSTNSSLYSGVVLCCLVPAPRGQALLPTPPCIQESCYVVMFQPGGGTHSYQLLVFRSHTYSEAPLTHHGCVWGTDTYSEAPLTHHGCVWGTDTYSEALLPVMAVSGTDTSSEAPLTHHGCVWGTDTSSEAPLTHHGCVLKVYPCTLHLPLTRGAGSSFPECANLLEVRRLASEITPKSFHFEWPSRDLVEVASSVSRKGCHKEVLCQDFQTRNIPQAERGSLLSCLGTFGGSSKDEDDKEQKINIFSVASGHLYERFLRIMMLSVLKHTNTPVKFWFLKNYLSPTLKDYLPHMAQEYGFEYELVQYKWPRWLHQQREKQRIIWGYKILFLDVLFPLDVKKIIFVDADQVVRADMKELVDLDLGGAPYGYTPFCESRTEMEGFRFWKTGYWRNHLQGRRYHISALYVVDLRRFRRIAAGDRLRGQYQALSQDPNSLSNLDQDLPNNMIHQVAIKSLPQEWLWCETWCDNDSKRLAKTIDLCNNPLTKEAKLTAAMRIVEEWKDYDAELKRIQKKMDDSQAEDISEVHQHTHTIGESERLSI
uniref:UDP-glucose:glycoprotein glucosyltransferase n=1 Tax=Timema bartmani TaxID=61472 RepID=A0A7R9EXQ3_9NEOP|nr:unnamed protein product [Timema bartmani]